MSLAADQNVGMRSAAGKTPGEEPLTRASAGHQIPLLATIPIDTGQRRTAIAVVVVLLMSFLIAAPFARTELPRIDAFIPAVQSVLFIVNLITAALLAAQFSVQPQRAVMMIACGYFFVALIVVVHTAMFPHAVAPEGLLDAGPQSAAWIFYFWHAGFALAVIGYALLKDRDAVEGASRRPTRNTIAFSFLVVIAIVGGLVLLVTIGKPLLPDLFQDDVRLGPEARYFSSAVTLLHVLALVLLYTRRRFLLDLWLMVALVADLPDIGLAIVLSVLRFSLGWYIARFYALAAASVLLVALLAETMALYARLARTVVSQWQDRATLDAMTRDIIAARDGADAANRAKSEFLAGISHEIRTPMTTVIGMTELLMNSGLNARQHRHAASVMEASQSLLAIVDDLLDLSKIEAGRLRLNLTAMSPSAVADGALNIVRSAAASKSITLRRELAADLPHWIEGDPTRLNQVLANLLSNAIKFTDHGSIVLRAFRAPGAERTQLRFEVADTGIGIDPAHQHLLFQKFSQVVDSTRREYGGTGLGLAICRELIGSMGGSIGVDSKSGEGSTFWFTIPLIEARPQVAMGLSEAPASAAPTARILVAEDRDKIREYIAAVLADAGHEVVAVQNGNEALAAISAADFDMVLMDIQMPELDGIAATRRIREMGDSVSNIPIIALTAYAMESDMERSWAAGASDHLTKPITSKELLGRVARWHGRRHEGGKSRTTTQPGR
jgi:signal transduction histidine kinase/ActR/RegA family two-component response regulator